MTLSSPFTFANKCVHNCTKAVGPRKTRAEVDCVLGYVHSSVFSVILVKVEQTAPRDLSHVAFVSDRHLNATHTHPCFCTELLHS